jgi:DNA repair protein RadA/Sms
LEHLVDTVLYLEGDSSAGFRLLRAIKNRFGSTGEVGVLLMTEKGLEDVTNPSALFLGSSGESCAPGSAISTGIEGTRSFLLEIQALVGNATYSNPRRVVSGMDTNRLSILIAVLEKHAGLAFGQNDVFASVAGGLRVTESAHDLATVAALYSSHRNRVMPKSSCLFGEVSLSGMVRPVRHGTARVREALKLGMKVIYLPADQASEAQAALGSSNEAQSQQPRIVPVRSVGNLLEELCAH